jgi:iron complex outermembrane receptor protein
LPLQGGPNFRSEELTAYEIGWRAQPSAAFSYSVAAFHNVYDELRSVEPAPGGTLVFDNKIKGHTDGIELSGSYQVNERWRLSAGYNALRERLQFKADSAQQITVLGDASTQSGNDPSHQFSLRSSMTLPHGVEFDFQLRRVGALPSPAVPAYSALDARLGWQVSPSVELSIAGFNLLDSRHAEFGAATPSRSELARSVMLKLLWKL